MRVSFLGVKNAGYSTPVWAVGDTVKQFSSLSTGDGFPYVPVGNYSLSSSFPTLALWLSRVGTCKDFTKG